MRTADPVNNALDPMEAASPAGWRMAMVFCHVLMGLTMLTAVVYVLVRLHVFDLF